MAGSSERYPPAKESERENEREKESEIERWKKRAGTNYGVLSHYTRANTAQVCECVMTLTELGNDVTTGPEEGAKAGSWVKQSGRCPGDKTKRIRVRRDKRWYQVHNMIDAPREDNYTLAAGPKLNQILSEVTLPQIPIT